MKKNEILKKNVVDIYFLMKYSLLGLSDFESEFKDKYIEVGKMFFEMLSNSSDATEEQYSEFLRKKSDVFDNIFEIHHEINEDDVRLSLEHKMLVFDYEKTQSDSLSQNRHLPILIPVSETEFFNE